MEDDLAPLVSVILPVFNGGDELRLAVQSIVAQSLVDWELIILDDGSTDLAVEHLVLEPRIRVIRDGERRGLSARLNEGTRVARGRYVARMDHDDIAHPDRLRAQAEFLDREPGVDLCGTRCLTMDENENVLGTLPLAVTHGEICARPWKGFYLAHPSWMGRIAWFRRNPYAEPGPYRCEDQELLLRSYATSRFAALSQPLLCYRVKAKPNFAVLVRTRFSLARLQARYFWVNGPRSWALLSTLACALRIASDVWRGIIGRPAAGTVDSGEAARWRAIIADVRAMATRKHVADPSRAPSRP